MAGSAIGISMHNTVGNRVFPTQHANNTLKTNIIDNMFAQTEQDCRTFKVSNPFLETPPNNSTSTTNEQQQSLPASYRNVSHQSSPSTPPPTMPPSSQLSSLSTKSKRTVIASSSTTTTTTTSTTTILSSSSSSTSISSDVLASKSTSYTSSSAPPRSSFESNTTSSGITSLKTLAHCLCVALRKNRALMIPRRTDCITLERQLLQRQHLGSLMKRRKEVFCKFTQSSFVASQDMESTSRPSINASVTSIPPLKFPIDTSATCPSYTTLEYLEPPSIV